MKKRMISGCLLALILVLMLGLCANAAGEITIVGEPEDIAARIGQTGSATVVAESDSALSYQWYFKSVNGTEWKVSGMSGAKTATISVPVTEKRLGQQYKCVITSADGATAETVAVMVCVAEPSVIRIDAQPTDIVAALGKTGSATVLASSDGAALNYQWYFKSVNSTDWKVSGMSGAKTATISVPVTSARIGQQYKCVITTTDGGRIETEAIKVAKAAPTVITIEEQPTEMKAKLGQNATATVRASAANGAALSYQWYFKSVNGTDWKVSGMSGAKTATISVPVTSARIGQQYKCVITTADGGRAESDAVTIGQSAPSVITVIAEPDDLYAFIGQNGTATVEASTDTGAAVSYQWYYKPVKSETWQASGMGGSKTATITVPVIRARIGQQYKCVLTTADGGRAETAVVTVYEKPDLDVKVTRNPDSYRTYTGEPVELDVSINLNTRDYPMSYQWYKDGEKIEGATESRLYFSSVTLEDAGSYYCVISGYGYTVTSYAGTVNVYE